MAVQTIWMRENMFGPVGQVYERRFTEAELKVQKSLQKLSIPSWFLNRSTPPKIINDFVHIECRTSTWKNPNSYKYSDSKKVANTIERNTEHARNLDDSGTYDTIKDVQVITETNKEDAAVNLKNVKDEQLNTDIPKVKLKKVSETYPRVSASRKIQNINIVFSRSPKFDYVKLSKDILARNDPLEKNSTSSPIEQQDLQEKLKINLPRKCCGKIESVTLKTDPPILRTPDMKGSFKIRSFSTPNGSPVSLFSSTLVEEDFLDSSRKERERSSIGSSQFQLNCIDRRTQKVYPIDVNVAKRKLQTLKYLLSRREELLRCKRASHTHAHTHTIMAARHNPNENLTMAVSVASSEENYRSDSDQSELACDKLSNSRRKSTELEKIVKSSQSFRSEQGFVRDMVNELNHKQKSHVYHTSPKNTRQVPDLNQTFVKMAVNALENGNASKARQILFEKGRIKDEDTEIESSSDSDLKSGTSSMSFSIRDSDSNSSSDLESTTSPILQNNQERRFSYDIDDIQKVTVNNSKKKVEVYWIPVRCCKICPSSWGKTYTKSRGPSRKLFPIDETAVTDSGFSDVYDAYNTTFTN